MSSPSDALRAAQTRLVILTWRGVWLNLVVVTSSVAALAASAYHRPFPWTGTLTGVIVALVGVQLWLADGQFTRLGTDRPHGWVRPLALAFLVAGAAFFVWGLLAAAHRLAGT